MTVKNKILMAPPLIANGTLKAFSESITQQFPGVRFTLEELPGLVVMTPHHEDINERKGSPLDIVDHADRHLPVGVNFELQCVHVTYGRDGKTRPIHPIGTHRRKPKEKKPNNRIKTNAPWKVNK